MEHTQLSLLVKELISAPYKLCEDDVKERVDLAASVYTEALAAFLSAVSKASGDKSLEKAAQDVLAMREAVCKVVEAVE